MTLDAGGIALSALLSNPARTPPRAVVVALHGAGMNAGYFDGQALPSLSLLTLGAALGYTVVAIDRPGYGLSAGRLPEGQTLAEQASTVSEALRDFGARYPTGEGLFILAHSFGGKLALRVAAGSGTDILGPNILGLNILGLDISSCGHRYLVAPSDLAIPRGDRERAMNWGPLRLYPPDTFRSSAALVAPIPSNETRDAHSWPTFFPGLATRVRVPVRFTFAEHESWWRHDNRALADLKSRLTATPRVLIDRQPDAGHNISLGWAARSYHLRGLGFLEECLLRRHIPTNSLNKLRENRGPA